jgi:hypothetical protein
MVAAHNDGAWAVSRGEPTTTSAVIVVGMHGGWSVRGISTAAGVNDTLGVAVASGDGGDSAPKSKSSVKLGSPSVKGKLGSASVKKALAAHVSDLRDCYDNARKDSPKLAGTVTITFTVADGKVTASSGAGVDDDLANCVAGVIDGVSFGKGGARVKLPVTFAAK